MGGCCEGGLGIGDWGVRWVVIIYGWCKKRFWKGEV